MGICGQITPARRHVTIPHALGLRWTCADAWVAWSQGGGAFIYRILVIETDGRLKTKRPLAYGAR
jgi:hypothetical protein